MLRQMLFAVALGLSASSFAETPPAAPLAPYTDPYNPGIWSNKSALQTPLPSGTAQPGIQPGTVHARPHAPNIVIHHHLFKPIGEEQ